jgi:hypothetical protein
MLSSHIDMQPKPNQSFPMSRIHTLRNLYGYRNQGSMFFSAKKVIKKKKCIAFEYHNKALRNTTVSSKKTAVRCFASFADSLAPWLLVFRPLRTSFVVFDPFKRRPEGTHTTYDHPPFVLFALLVLVLPQSSPPSFHFISPQFSLCMPVAPLTYALYFPLTGGREVKVLCAN